MNGELKKMLSGELYDAGDPELYRMRLRARRLTWEFNATTEEEHDLRATILKELFASVGSAFIEPPFYCDYGSNICAGEQGRGFAVVADEVRKLAEGSLNETKVISGLIEQTLAEVGKVASAIRGTNDLVEESLPLVIESTEVLHNISNHAANNLELAHSVVESSNSLMEGASDVNEATVEVVAVADENAAASQHMAASIQQVQKAIENVAAISEENAASVEEVAASTEQITASLQQMSSASHSLADMAARLQQLAARFKLA
jgi:methyl-accepting chemotaxis protein